MATVTLTWSPGSGGPVTDYTVYRKASSGTLTAAQIIASPDNTVPNVASGYADTTLSSGSGKVWYTVTAQGPGGSSADGAAAHDVTL